MCRFRHGGPINAAIVKSINLSPFPPSFNKMNLLLFAVFLLVLLTFTHLPVHAGKTKVHIPDDLDDVIDGEEDEEWKSWGRKKSSAADSEFNPPNLTQMDKAQVQAEIMKSNVGPAFGFVKLKFGVKRTKDMVAGIAMKWTKVARTGGIEAKFTGVDLSTVMFTMERGQETLELKDFVLIQPEAYEIKIGDQVFRRPGDPPVEEVLEMLQVEKNKGDEGSQKDEL